MTRSCRYCSEGKNVNLNTVFTFFSFRLIQLGCGFIIYNHSPSSSPIPSIPESDIKLNKCLWQERGIQRSASRGASGHALGQVDAASPRAGRDASSLHGVSCWSRLSLPVGTTCFELTYWGLGVDCGTTAASTGIGASEPRGMAATTATRAVRRAE